MKTNIKLIVALAGIAFTGAAQAETILFAGAQGIVYELDTVTGQIGFRGSCGGPVNSMVVHDNMLFLGDQSGLVYTLDLATDLVTGLFAVESDASAMAWLGDELVVADSSGEISYVNASSFETTHTLSVVGTDITAIGIDAGGLFVGGQSSIAQRAHIGQDNFQFFAACGSMINSIAFGTDTMYLGGIAFGGSVEGTVYLFDKFEGGVEYSGTHEVDSDATSLIYADGMLYIGGTDGRIHEMNPNTGDITRVFHTEIDIQAMTLESGLESCPADYDASGSVNFVDVSRFIELFSNEVVPADINGDGNFNFFDISEFLRIYVGGC